MFSLCMLLSACRASKELTTQQKEQRKRENDVSLIDTSLLVQIVNRTTQKRLDEMLGLQIDQKVYDTDKMIDPKTGKHPLKEETHISLNKKTKELQTDSTTTKTNESTQFEVVDKSKDQLEIEGLEQVNEKKGFTFWEALGLSVVSSLFIGFVIFLISKFK